MCKNKIEIDKENVFFSSPNRPFLVFPFTICHLYLFIIPFECWLESFVKLLTHFRNAPISQVADVTAPVLQSEMTWGQTWGKWRLMSEIIRCDHCDACCSPCPPTEGSAAPLCRYRVQYVAPGLHGACAPTSRNPSKKKKRDAEGECELQNSIWEQLSSHSHKRHKPYISDVQERHIKQEPLKVRNKFSAVTAGCLQPWLKCFCFRGGEWKISRSLFLKSRSPIRVLKGKHFPCLLLCDAAVELAAVS